MSQDLSILLVEDNDDDIVLIEEAFAAQDDNSVKITNMVHDGEEAMAFLNGTGKFANRSLPGLILLDINMPKKNGFEVLAAIKNTPHLQHLPVVMLTTSEREEDILKSFSGGACSYIRKPPSLSAMTNIIREFSHYWGNVTKVPTIRQ